MKWMSLTFKSKTIMIIRNLSREISNSENSLRKKELALIRVKYRKKSCISSLLMNKLSKLPRSQAYWQIGMFRW